MKKLRLTKKAKVGILVIIASILLIGLIVIISNFEQPKRYDVDNLKSALINEFEELNLFEMDNFDVLAEFGFGSEEVPDGLYLKSLVMDEKGQDVTEDKNIIIILNTENYQYYHDIFQSHIESNIMYTEDKKIFKLYNKAILKSEENYVYLIVSNKAKDIEKFINE